MSNNAAAEGEPGRVTVSVIDYDADHCDEYVVEDMNELSRLKTTPSTSWIRVVGVCDATTVSRIGGILGIDQNLAKDVTAHPRRPRLHDYSDHVFISLRLLESGKGRIISFPMGVAAARGLVLSFERKENRVLDNLVRRIREGGARIRDSGADFLVYGILDAASDKCFVMLEKLALRMERLEEELLSRPGIDTLKKIHRVKMDLIVVRKTVWPLRHIANRLTDGDSKLIKDSTRPHLVDLHNQVIYAAETVEVLRDMASGMIDIYLSSVNNKLNEIMRWLTTIATIFIPLTFLSGWYGMNFKSMPELNWEWGYVYVISIAVSVVFIILLLFKRKNWL
ncbi:MAG: magnesium/cobalt transporter CorA [Pseudomonadota bacterium]